MKRRQRRRHEGICERSWRGAAHRVAQHHVNIVATADIRVGWLSGGEHTMRQGRHEEGAMGLDTAPHCCCRRLHIVHATHWQRGCFCSSRGQHLLLLWNE